MNLSAEYTNNTHMISNISSRQAINKFSLLFYTYAKCLSFKYIFNLAAGNSIISRTGESFRHNHLKNKKFRFLYNPGVIEPDEIINKANKFNYLNYYYLNNYHQSVIYYNNLVLALVILFILFSVLVLLEDDESYYNLSAISFILLITFNLMLLIFAHSLAKQFLSDQNFYHSSQYFTNYGYHHIY